MNQRPHWYFNEMLPPGRDYFSRDEVRIYDERHHKFRDIEADNERILDLLDVQDGRRIIDIGTGTGDFAVQAARRGAIVDAVDISQAMLDVARQKAVEAHVVDKIDFHLGGFLSYEHHGLPADTITSQLVLHHLPDFWKLVALQRVSAMLRPGGHFFLADLVYSFPPNEYETFFNESIELGRQKIDDGFASDYENHVREEYSTPDWIMEGLLTRAGFTITQADYHQDIHASYVCQKNSSKDA